MSDSIPNAITTRKKRFSIVWLIPLLALALGGWLTFKYLYERGIAVQIEFSSAAGLAAGKTRIKYKDIEVGIVDDITFSADLEKVIVSATIDRDMADFLNKQTRFWVVRARVAAGEISGLETLLAGAYIGMAPGDGEKRRNHFVGLDKPPVLLTEDHGSRFQLQAESLHAFEPGAPVYYRRLKVGEVISYALDQGGEQFNIELFVHAPYNQLVYQDTLFWNAGGVDVQLGADGFELQTESLVSVLLGGIAFDNLGTRDDERVFDPAPSGTQFLLYKNRKTAVASGHKRGDHLYRVYFDGSARGLNIGAPVTLRGITVGYVTDLRLEYDLDEASFKIPVTIEFESDRVEMTGNQTIAPELSAEELVRRGLRAQLRTGNLLTGQMLIDLDIYPDLEPVEVYYEDEVAVLPTIPTTIDSLMLSVNEIMLKISEMPLHEIADNLNSLLAGANDIVHSSELRDSIVNVESITGQLDDSLVEISTMVTGLNELVSGINDMVNSVDVKQTIGNIQSATGKLDHTLAQVDNVAAGFRQDSDAYQSLLRLMHELSAAARSLRQMADYLERHPEALLQGKGR